MLTSHKTDYEAKKVKVDKLNEEVSKIKVTSCNFIFSTSFSLY